MLLLFRRAGRTPGMSRLVTVKDEVGRKQSDRTWARALRRIGSRQHSVFPANAIRFSRRRFEFLLGLKQTDASFHKNIAYRPAEDRITGLDKSAQGPEVDRLRAIVAGYSRRSTEFLAALLPPYGQVEIGLRELSPARRAGTSSAFAGAQRFAACRCVSDAADQRRPHPAPLHQHQSLAKSRVDHEPDIRRDRPAVRKDARLPRQKDQTRSRRRCAELQTPHTCRARIDRRTTISCTAATTR